MSTTRHNSRRGSERRPGRGRIRSPCGFASPHKGIFALLQQPEGAAPSPRPRACRGTVHGRRVVTMAGFLLRKTGAALIVVFVVSVVVFAAVRAVPGDPATVMSGDDPTLIPYYRHLYGLDQP